MRHPMSHPRAFGAALLLCAALAFSLPAQKPAGKNGDSPKGPQSDFQLVRQLNSAREKYQSSLEQLRAHYLKVGDVERAKWAEDELRQYHRVSKQAFRLELDVPPPTLEAKVNVPEANELYRRAMLYKDKGWNTDYIDNQRRAELLLQQLLSQYPQSDKIGDAAYQLGDIYESKAYKQYRRAAYYFQRCFQWNRTTKLKASLRTAASDD